MIWRSIIVFAALLLSPLLAHAQLGNEIARKQLIEVLSDSTGLTVSVGALEGSLLSGLSAQDMVFSDGEGPVLEVGSVRFEWLPKRLLKRELVISNLELGQVRIRRAFSLTGASAEPILDVATDEQPLEPLPAREAYDLFGIDLPRLPVTVLVERFSLERLQLDAPLLDVPVALRAQGALLIPHTDEPLELVTNIRRVDDVAGELRGQFAYKPTTQQLAVSTIYREAPGGLFQSLTPLSDERGVAFTLEGNGLVTNWQGQTEFIVDRFVKVKGNVAFTEQPSSREQVLNAAVTTQFGDDLRKQYPGLLDDLAELKLSARYLNQTLVVLDRFSVRAPAIQASGQGQLNSTSGEYDFKLDLNSRDLSPLAQLAGVELAGGGELRVEASQKGNEARLALKGLVQNFRIQQVTTPRAQLDIIIDNPPLVSAANRDQSAPLDFAISLATRELGIGAVQLASQDRDLDLFAAGSAKIAGENSALELVAINLNAPGVAGRGRASLTGARLDQGQADFTLTAPDLANLRATRGVLDGGSAEIELDIADGEAAIRADASGLRWKPQQDFAVVGRDILISTALSLAPVAEGEERRLPLEVSGSNVNGSGALIIGKPSRLNGDFKIGDVSAIAALRDLIDGGGYDGKVGVRFEEKRLVLALDGVSENVTWDADALGDLVGKSFPVKLRLNSANNKVDIDEITVQGRTLTMKLDGQAGEGVTPRFEGEIALNELFSLLDELPVSVDRSQPVEFRFEGPPQGQGAGGFIELDAKGVAFTGDLAKQAKYIGGSASVATRWPITAAGLLLGDVSVETDAGLTAEIQFTPPTLVDQLDGKPGRQATAEIAFAHPGLFFDQQVLDAALQVPLEGKAFLALSADQVSINGSAAIPSGAFKGSLQLQLSTDRKGAALEVPLLSYSGTPGNLSVRASLAQGQVQSAELQTSSFDLSVLKAALTGTIEGQATVKAAREIETELVVRELRLADEQGAPGIGVVEGALTLTLPEAKAILGPPRNTSRAQRFGALAFAGQIDAAGITAAPDDAGKSATIASLARVAFEGLGDRFAARFAVEGAQPSQKDSLPLRGKGTGRLEGLASYVMADQDAAKGELRAALDQLTVETDAGDLVLSKPARLEFGEARRRFSLPELRGAGLIIAAEGEVAGGQIVGRATVDAPDIALLPGLDKFKQAHGQAQARIDLSGAAANPDAIGSFWVRNLALVQDIPANPRAGTLPPLDVAGTLRLVDSTVTVDGRARGPREMRADLLLSVPVKSDFEKLSLGLDIERTLRGRASGIMRLLEVAEYLDLDGDELLGTVRFDTSITGTTDKPALDGRFAVENATFESYRSGLVLENINIVGRADGQSLRFQSSPQSSISAQGEVDLGSEDGTPLDMKVTFQRQNLIARDDLNAILSGDLIIRGKLGERINISGDVVSETAEFSLAATGVGTAPDLEVVEINKPNSLFPVKTEARPNSNVFANINIRTADDIVFRGGGVNTRWQALLLMQGPVDKPFLTGNITNSNGRLTVLGDEFTVTRGDISYSQDPISDPRLDLQAERQAGDLLVLLTLSGSATSPQVELTSVPELPTDEILARLLFGEDINALDGVQAAELAIALLRLQNIGRSDDFLERVRTLANLDQLTLSADSNDVTRLRAGKNVAKPLLLWVEQGLQVDSGRVGARYDIAPGLNAEADYGVDKDARLKLDWSRDF